MIARDRRTWRGWVGSIHARRLVSLTLAVAVTLSFSFGCGRSASTDDPPPICSDCNVLLVTFDALRADRLGAYGFTKPTSPALDALAAKAVVFTRNISQSGTTLSSLPSLFTSKFPHTDRLLRRDERVGHGRLRAAEKTLAEILRGEGYATLAVISHRYASCDTGICQGFDHVDDDFVAPEPAATTRARATALLDAHATPPFFLWIHFLPPHSPYQPEREVFEELYQGAEDAPTFYTLKERGFWPQISALTAHYAALGEPEKLYEIANSSQKLTPTVLRQIRALYEGNVRAADGEFGRLLEHLERRGMAGRTIVVVASDHGESLGAHQLIGHNELFYPVLHTPLMVFAPGARATRRSQPVMNVDVMPTVLGLLGKPIPDGIRGTNAFAQLDPERPQYAEYSSRKTLIRGRWKLTLKGARHQTIALHDLEEDADETEDLSRERPEIVKELREIAEGISRVSLANESDVPDSQVIEQLKALGYIGK